MKTRFWLLACVIAFTAGAAKAQVPFPYAVTVTPYALPGLDGLQSYVHAEHDGKWIFIGGRLDGLHARQPFNAFPGSQNNDRIWVVDPATNQVWTASVSTLPTGLSEQLQSTNMQFYQDGPLLVIVGGYAYSESVGDHLTFPSLTTVDLPGLVAAIVQGQAIGSYFQQINDEVFAVTGGNLGKIGEEYLLVGGHRFDGRYNPMGHPTYTQVYTDAIRKFTLQNTGGTWAFANYTAIADPVHLHRRDYNLLPQVFADGQLGYTLFSGVFQINEDLPFLYTIDLKADGHAPVDSFNQYLCNYHTAHAALFDGGSNAMHNLFFGGIGQYYYEGDNLVQDNQVPFVKTISRVSRGADGSLTELRLPVEMPGYFGASAELILDHGLPQLAPGIVDLAAIGEDSFLLGYIVGGLESASQNPFSVNDTETTAATTTLFKVSLRKSTALPAGERKMPGYHGFTIGVSPNPVPGQVFQIAAFSPEAGKAEIFLADAKGALLLNKTLEGLPQGHSQIEVALDKPVHGLTLLTVQLNGKYTATARVVFE